MAQPRLEDLVRDGLRARLARAAASQAAVLVIPSAAGINPFIDRTLVELADAGLTALAWDPFSARPDLAREERGKYTETVQQDSIARAEHVRWLDHLAGDLGAVNLGVVGYCMGGRMSLLLAAVDARIKAAAAYYPTMRDPVPANVIELPPAAAAIACPVLVHYPGLDHLTSQASLHKLRAALESRPGSAPTQIGFYPKAHHGFQSKAAEEDQDDYAAGRLAWPATLAFLKAALKPA